ncbi:MAG: hypothetical protein PHF84_06340 [bacterium]|nr:hypothetical protein [bacterium]
MKKIILLILLMLPCVPGYGEWRTYDVYRCGAKGLAAGGAFTAIADDVSAIYYNPAGLVQTKTFVIFYTFDSQIRIVNIIDPTLKLTYKVPALVGFVYPFKDSFNTVLAVSATSPYQRKIPNEFAVYKFAPSLAMQILPFLSLGLNVGLDYATYSEANSPDGLGFDVQIGVLYTPSRIVHAGLNYNSRTTIDWGKYGTIGNLEETFPDILRAGTAVLVSPKIIVSFDLEYQNWQSIRFVEDGTNKAPGKALEHGLFKTIHPHLGLMFLEESSGAHIRLGLYTDSFFQKDIDTFRNKTQLLWTIGLGAYAFKILKVEAGLADSLLGHLINKDNNRIETVQITVEYRF